MVVIRAELEIRVEDVGHIGRLIGLIAADLTAFPPISEEFDRRHEDPTGTSESVWIITPGM